jgi:hypothetical protein
MRPLVRGYAGSYRRFSLINKKSQGESNAVFLIAWGGDVASQPPKTGRAHIRKRIFPGAQVVQSLFIS